MIAGRDATPADLAAVDALFRRSFTETFGHLYAADDLAAFFARFTSAAWAEELARPDLRLRLAERDGALAGFAKTSAPTLPLELRGPTRELRQLYLADEAKGSGVGPALMAWAIAEARAQGARDLILSVYVDNHRARRFYARHGFTEVGTYAFMVGSHADEDVMMRLAL